MSEEISKKSKLALITAGLAGLHSANSLKGQAVEWYKDKFLYTATLKEDAFVFNEVLDYIDVQANTRSFKFLSTRSGVKRYFNSDGLATFYVDGHKLEARLHKPEGADNFGGDSYTFSLKNSLHFSSRTPDGLQALENLMVEMTKKKQIEQKSVYVATPTKYGEWDYSNIPKKKISSVFLPMGEKESLLKDIDRFLESEDHFLKVGLPWHRGYCFYGEPGNGKSSLALAIANHFALDLHTLPLSSMDGDANLQNAISAIKNKSILLLEDIDIYSNSMSREQKDNSPTLAGLLNSLDGVSTPHGLITIMTTNRFESLDSALVRPGRMDYRLELKAPVAYQIESMFAEVFGEGLGSATKEFDSMAAVADVFKRHLDDANAVRQELTI